ncbi:MAG: ABC transporter permease subunit [Nannocystaceae bacterium]|nr:ABC transporter permease subunit [Nannocystaceae bacterium]
MRGILLVARRDLGAYFNSYWGFAVIAAVLVIDGLLFNAFALGNTAKYSAKVIEDFFYWSFGLTAIASVFMTMRLVAEERQTGTIVLIDASPIAPWQFVGGKYISAMVVMALLVLSTIYMPALVFVNGKVSYGHLVAGYSGLLLVAAACSAIGTLASAVARSQLVAGVISASMVGFFVLGWMVAKVTDPPLNDLFSYMSFFDRHFRGFGRGQINSEDVVFYLSIVFVSLMLASRFMAARRWR